MQSPEQPRALAVPTRGRQLAAALRRAAFGVGPVATARAVVQRLLRRGASPAEAPSGPPPGPHPFDLEFGVDTGGFRSWRELQAGGANDPYISGYLGVAPSIGRRLIGLVEKPEEYAFVDIGCGKGRPLILASERPFRRIVGIEIAAELAEAAKRNAASLAARYPERPRIEVVQGDAAQFDFPPEPLVLFFYQPFEMPVMRAVVRRLTDSLARSPRAAVILYVNPALARVFDRLPGFERAAEAKLDPTEAERPFGYGGRGGADPVMVWRTTAPRPALAPL